MKKFTIEIWLAAIALLFSAIILGLTFFSQAKQEQLILLTVFIGLLSVFLVIPKFFKCCPRSFLYSGMAILILLGVFFPVFLDFKTNTQSIPQDILKILENLFSLLPAAIGGNYVVHGMVQGLREEITK